MATALNFTKGFPKTFTSTTPSNKAIGGEMIENKHNTIIEANNACCRC